MGRRLGDCDGASVVAEEIEFERESVAVRICQARERLGTDRAVQVDPGSGRTIRRFLRRVDAGGKEMCGALGRWSDEAQNREVDADAAPS